MREPCVAGQFYPANPDKLRAMVESFLFSCERIRAQGVLAPHAGYVYSGRVAGYAYSRIEVSDIVVVIGPNHTGYGKPVGISDEDFRTPLGTVECYRQSTLGSVDKLSHLFEHSIEVQLPFLQVLKKDFRLVAITMMDQRHETAVSLGRKLHEVMPEDTLVIASSDMCHYVPEEVAEKKDQMAIEEMKRMDTRGLYDTVLKNDITMCGYGCAIAMMTFASLRGAEKGELLKHGTSGDAEPMSEVVGYCAMAFR
jgi:hypothetical protein